MQIAVIGAGGQLGSEIVRAAHAAGLSTISLSHEQCEVTDGASIARAFSQLSKGDIVVNTAAFHRTDECEEKADRALAVNTLGAYRVADAAQQRGVTAIYFSTDYVFDGAKKNPYVESDAPNPINVYGASKAAGEMLVRSANIQHYVIRVSSVFGVAGSGGKGGNFVESMVSKSRSGEQLEVVNDITMAPTSASDAAAALVQLLQRKASFGVYHLANAGQCTWCEFANAIFELIGTSTRAKPVSVAARPMKVRRPAYSVLASEKLAELRMQPRPWKEALIEYLRQKGHMPA